ncbi:MAG: DUF4139 domain-containing protein [Acetobacteraceae bacterium]|nr:DUF4139 domain-containing protein [Acetobacteraceae bacterium]
MRRTSLALTLIAPAALAAEMPVRGVTLSSAGIAQIERAGEVAANAPVVFRAPLGDVDDLLRSLMILDPAGRVEGLSLPARDLLNEAFRGLPLRPADFENRASLLNALRGQEVEAAGARGRIATAAETDAGLHLSLIGPRGLLSVQLKAGDEVTLTDPALAARVARAAEALAAARSDDERRIEIRLRSDRARQVAVIYIAGAPLWKPSYRLMAPALGATGGQARLMGWAVVENASGSDWEGVRISLVSDDAAAFRQPIFEPITVPRPELPVRIAEAIRVRPDTGPMPRMPAAASMMAPPAAAPPPTMNDLMNAPSVSAAPAPAPAPAPLAVNVAAQAAAGRVAFTLERPVTLRSGETANLPFLDLSLPAERVWWVQNLWTARPLQALRFRNTSNHVLPDGLVTVFDGDGAPSFLGDAELRALSPGDQRLIAFARDRDMRLSSQSVDQFELTRFNLRRGFMTFTAKTIDETVVTIDPRGASGVMVIDLPRRHGATPRFPVVAEGDFGLRFETQLEAAPKTIRLGFERTESQDIALWDQGLGDPLLLQPAQFDLEASLRRLPGGPGSVERLQETLSRTGADVPGRDVLASTITALQQIRVLLDSARLAAREARSADQALTRARQAVEDRTGGEQQAARQRLNAASREAEAKGAASSRAFEAWQRAVVALLQQGS